MADTGKEHILSELKRLIVEELGVNLAAADIDAETPFFEGGLGIDSIAVVELISLVEERFGIRFADEDLVPDSFASIRTLAGVIAMKPVPPLAR